MSLTGKKYVFKFESVKFKTDEGDGEDKSLEALLDRRYGKKQIAIEATNAKRALQEAIRQLKDESGFDVLDADYQMSVT